MTILSKELRDEAIAHAKEDRKVKESYSDYQRRSRWKWGDWSLKVSGPVGEAHLQDGAMETLEAAREEILSDDKGGLIIPEVYLLRDYRYAASAIPPKLRETVRSVEAGRLLGRKVKDRLELHRLVEALKNDKGVVTLDAVREHFDRVPTNTGRMRMAEEADWNPPRPPRTRGEKVKMARELMEDPSIAKSVVATPGKVGNVVSQALSQKAAADRRARQAARAEQDEQNALPLSAYEQRLIKRLNDIALELAPNALPYEDLGEVARDRVADAFDNIVDNARASAARCRPPVEVDQGNGQLDRYVPIDGTAREAG
jgi:hypothetical protein